MPDIRKKSTCIVCLLPLLSISLSFAQQQPVCGLPVQLISVNVDELKMAQKGSMVNCDGIYNKEMESLINNQRPCPSVYEKLHDSASDSGGGSQRFPSTWYEAVCRCASARVVTPGPCARIRLPVTELRRSRRGHGNQSRLYYTEVTRLRSVDCEVLLPPALKDIVAPTTLTGDVLRFLGRQVGRSMFMHVDCCRHHPSASFGIDLQRDRVPTMLPEARCPCLGQAPVFLPIGVLRRVWDASGNNMVLSDIRVLAVSCALLDVGS